MEKKKLKVTLILSGILSVIFSAAMLVMDNGNYESYQAYGGDAYTGIQNAAATAANNVNSAACLVAYGFAFILFVLGIVLIGAGIAVKKEEKNTTQASAVNVSSASAEAEKGGESGIETTGEVSENISEVIQDYTIPEPVEETKSSEEGTETDSNNEAI